MTRQSWDNQTFDVIYGTEERYTFTLFDPVESVNEKGETVYERENEETITGTALAKIVNDYYETLS